MSRTTSTFQFNKSQKRLVVCPASATSVWGRGNGKSTMIAWIIHCVVQSMPRSSWAIAGNTYKQMLTRTLPSTVQGLEMLGYKRDVHYVVGVRPPQKWKWPVPHQPPLSYDNYISFYTGAGFHLISLSGGGGSSRGLNIDGYITDEHLLIDEEKLFTDVEACNRGNLGRWGSRMHHGRFKFSSMPYAGQGEGLLQDGAYIYDMFPDRPMVQEQLHQLQLDWVACEHAEQRRELWRDIAALEKRMTFPVNPKNGLLYSEANSFQNMANLGFGYIRNLWETMPEYMFSVEVLNMRPTKIRNGFYPHLSLTKHCYQDTKYTPIFTDAALAPVGDGSVLDGDVDPAMPLRIAVDFGDRISIAVVGQQHPAEYRFVNNFHVLHPQLVKDLARKFAEYYAYHQRKVVYFIRDNEYGNRHGPGSRTTYNIEFADELRALGWHVNEVDLGRIPDQQLRYMMWQNVLKEESPAPPVRFNLVNCKETIASMQNAPVTRDTRTNRIKKDKRSERTRKDQTQATHFSDAADLHMVALLRDAQMGSVAVPGIIR